MIRAKSRWRMMVAKFNAEDLHDNIDRAIDRAVERDDPSVGRKRLQLIEEQVDALVAHLMWIEEDMPDEDDGVTLNDAQKIKEEVENLNGQLTTDSLVKVRRIAL